MLICSQCKKTFRQESKFCSDCGAPLMELSGDAAGNEQGSVRDQGYANPLSAGMGSSGKNEPPVQPAAGFPVHHEMEANPAGYPSTQHENAGTGKKTGAGAMAGMFVVNCIPILGFPAAFLWAQAKMKRTKGKLAVVTAVFLVLNIAVTLLAYAVTINLMKNSLVKAVESARAEDYPISGHQKLPGSKEADPSITVPGNENDIPIQDIPGIDSGMLEQFIPGFSGMEGENGVNPEDYQLPEGVGMPEVDEDGNMHVDADGDGVVDMIIDSKGNILSSNVQIPSVDNNGNVFIDQDGDGETDMTVDPSGEIVADNDMKLPEMGEDGNMYLDTDGDGEYDSYMIDSGHIVPMGDRTKTDEKGNRFIDYDGNGTFEVMIDTEGVEHYDMDGDGKYETSFEENWGEG